MRNISTIFLFLMGIILFASCNDYETYAEQKEKENKAINAYITNNKVKVISEDQFEAQNYKTNNDENEFVLFESSGVYMQVVREGCGEKMKNGETCTILCRFTERNLMGDSIQLSNDVLYYSAIVEKMVVSDSYGTFSGSFDTSSSLMYSAYTSQSVPSGWLLPLGYIKLGRPTNPGDEIAKVRIIVPHKQGQYYASQNVYPCLYDLTYERGL